MHNIKQESKLWVYRLIISSLDNEFLSEYKFELAQMLLLNKEDMYRMIIGNG